MFDLVSAINLAASYEKSGKEDRMSSSKKIKKDNRRFTRSVLIDQSRLFSRYTSLFLSHF